jgi:hypothetical protein
LPSEGFLETSGMYSAANLKLKSFGPESYAVSSPAVNLSRLTSVH